MNLVHSVIRKRSEASNVDIDALPSDNARI